MMNITVMMEHQYEIACDLSNSSVIGDCDLPWKSLHLLQTVVNRLCRTILTVYIYTAIAANTKSYVGSYFNCPSRID